MDQKLMKEIESLEGTVSRRTKQLRLEKALPDQAEFEAEHQKCLIALRDLLQGEVERLGDAIREIRKG